MDDTIGGVEDSEDAPSVGESDSGDSTDVGDRDRGDAAGVGDSDNTSTPLDILKLRSLGSSSNS